MLRGNGRVEEEAEPLLGAYPGAKPEQQQSVQHLHAQTQARREAHTNGV